MPISRQVRMTLSAISPRLAINIFLNMLLGLSYYLSRHQAAGDGLSEDLLFYQEKRLVVFDRRGILYQYLYDLTLYFAFDLVEEFHRFDNANYFTWCNRPH
jgi:hypothetical protein